MKSQSCNLDFSFSAKEVMHAVKVLDDEEVQQIRDDGFSTFLELKLEAISERKEIHWLLNQVCLEEERIAVKISPDVVLYITEEEIYHLLRLPRGGDPPLENNGQQQKEFKSLRTELGVEDLSIKKISELMENKEYKHLKIKCFYLILISKFLIPTTQSAKVNVHAVMYTQNLAKIKDYDWCNIVYMELRKSIREFPKKIGNSKKIDGCIIILLGYIADNMKLTEIVDKKCPRINQLTLMDTIQTLMDSIKNTKCLHGDDSVTFDKFKLKPLEETCYAESSRSSRLHIQSPADSQHSMSAGTSAGPMPPLDQAHGYHTRVQRDLEGLDACIAGVARSMNLGPATSCRSSEISGPATSCRPSEISGAGVNLGDETSCGPGISGVAIAAQKPASTKNCGRGKKSASTKDRGKKPAAEGAALRRSTRHRVVTNKENKVVSSYRSLENMSPSKSPSKKKRKPLEQKNTN